MSNLNVENLFVIGPTGKEGYKSQIQSLVESSLAENDIDVNSTDVYEILNSLGYELSDLSDPSVVDIVATKISQAVIKLVKDRKAKLDKNEGGESYHKFCAAIDSNCAVSLSVKAKLQIEQLPELSFIDLPHIQN